MKKFETAVKIALSTIAILLGVDSTFASADSLLPSYNVSSQRNSLEKTINDTRIWRNDTSSLTETAFYCSGITYGWDLLATSCTDAVFQIEPSRQIVTFGNRRQGAFDVPLPSRTLSADGTCAFTVEVRDAVEDQASLRDIRLAAAKLVQTCLFSHRRSEGGVASGIGRNGHLVIVMTDYTPQVRCENPRGPAPSDCRNVYHLMRLSQNYVDYVHQDPVGADILVPHVMQPAQENCNYIVDVAGSADFESTYHIWEAMVALDDMCARFGKVGTAYGLGQEGKVIVELVSGNTAAISSS